MRKLLLFVPLLYACADMPKHGISALADADSLSSLSTAKVVDEPKRKLIVDNWIVEAGLFMPSDVETVCFDVEVEAGDDASLNISQEMTFEAEQDGKRFRMQSGLKKIMRRVASDGFNCLICAKKIDRGKPIRLYIQHKKFGEQYIEWAPH